MTEVVTLARLAGAMEGYGHGWEDVLETNDWELEGSEDGLWALVDYCPECGTYQRKSELVNHPHDEGSFICRTCLRDLPKEEEAN